MAEIEFNGRKWLWPDDDQHLHLVIDQVQALGEALKHVHSFENAVQAGGAMGVWPVALAQQFRTVWTFEPCNDNFKYLNHNTKDLANITPCRLALGRKDGWCDVRRPQSEQNNAGAYYTAPAKDGGVPVVSLDRWLPYNIHVGFIQLDIEGNEYNALLGADRILTVDRPVVMIERKPLPQDTELKGGDPVELLIDKYDYKLKGHIYRDVIFVPR